MVGGVNWYLDSSVSTMCFWHQRYHQKTASRGANLRRETFHVQRQAELWAFQHGATQYQVLSDEGGIWEFRDCWHFPFITHVRRIWLFRRLTKHLNKVGGSTMASYEQFSHAASPATPVAPSPPSFTATLPPRPAAMSQSFMVRGGRIVTIIHGAE